MGTSGSVMESIAQIRSTALQLKRKDAVDATVVAPLHLTRALLEYQRNCQDLFDIGTAQVAFHGEQPHDLHLRAFQAATVIYYYQTCDEATPRSLWRYVSVVLPSLSAFFESCGGCFTLWPLIIAATEAYEVKQQSQVLALLGCVAKAGMRNLANHSWFLQRVWDTREMKSFEEGTEVADTRVDWRDVMHEAAIDLLVF